MKTIAAGHLQTGSLYSRNTRREALKGLGLAALMTALPSYASNPAPEATSGYPKLVISAKDYSFELPGQIPAGYTEVTLRNDGSAEHHAMLMRLHPGKTLADFMDVAQHQDVGALFSVSTSVGGPGSVGHGQASTVIVDLKPGQYVVICLVPGDKGMPHYKMGMLAPLTVTPATAGNNSRPHASGAIDMIDFSFRDMPATVPAGSQTWEVTDTSQQLHELVLNRIAPGASFQQIAGILKSTPPEALGTPSGPALFVAVAGVAPMNPGGVNWAVLDLKPAHYFAICYVPDAKTGKPHFDLGMMMPFTVA